MKWQGRRESTNVDDQRGGGGSGGFGGFGGGSPGGLFSKGGLIVVVIVVIIGWATGKNPLTLLSQLSSGNSSYTTVQSDSDYQPSPEEEELASFTKVVLADTEDVWRELMKSYREPTLVLFTGHVQSGCGTASASSGPFYCSDDEKLYIDLSFYKELKNQLNAPGDFAEAYVIAHEVGHHVQHLLGIIEKVHNMRSGMSEEEYNKLSVKLELQADFLAGVWANHANQMKNILEPGDIDEALNAASAVGDDRLQKQFQGVVVPDSFTHGTSEQRMYWFKRGFETGNPEKGDTFSETQN